MNASVHKQNLKSIFSFLQTKQPDKSTIPRTIANTQEYRRCVVKLKDVCYSYDKKNSVLKGINLEVHYGSSLMVIGSSGSGKTTLLKMINGLLRPSRGSVNTLNYELMDSKSCSQVRKHVGYIPQQLGLVRNKTALQNALMGALPRIGFINSTLNIFPKQEIDLANQNLSLVGLGEKFDKKIYTLSGGERQRVAIARALMQKPKLILADEFISDLDYLRAREIMDIVENLRGQGITLILATHDISIAAQYGQTAIVMKNGEIVDQMQANQLTHDLLEEKFTR